MSTLLKANRPKVIVASRRLLTGSTPSSPNSPFTKGSGAAPAVALRRWASANRGISLFRIFTLRALPFLILIFTFSILPSSAAAWYDSNYGFCRKLTMTAGGTSGGVATTTTAGFTLWATSTISSLAATSSSGRIQKYNYASSTPTDVAFTNGTDCNSDGGSAIDFTWDSYASTTGAFAVAIEAGDISSTTAKSVLLYYGYNADTTHENDTGTFGALGEVGVWPLGTSTTLWSALRTWDRGPNRRHGTITNFPASTPIVPGMIGSAIDFPGVDDYIDLGTSVLNYDKTATYLAWFNADVSQTAAIFLHDVNTTSGFSGMVCGGFWLDSATLTGGVGDGSYVAVTKVVSIGSWNHAVLIKNIETAKVQLYVNGVFIGEAAFDLPNLGIFGGTNRCNSNKLKIGREESNSGFGGTPNGYFNGKIDDVRIVNRALHAMDILTIYNNTRSSAIFWTFGGEETEGPPENPPTVIRTGATTTISMTLLRPSNNIGLVGWWTFDGKDMISNVRDRSGQGNHGNLSGQISTTTAPGKLGQALKLDGVDDYVKILDATSLHLTTTLSVSFWMNSESLMNAGVGNKHLVSRSNGGGTQDYTVYFDSNTGKICLYRGANAVCSTTTSWSANTWYHINVTHDGTTAVIFVNGAQENSTGFVSTPSSTNNLIFGANNGSSQFFKGILDDVRIYSRTLSPSEVNTLYQTGTPVRISTSKAGGDSLKSGLVGWWTFDGPNMIPNVRDKSGQGNHGNLIGQTATTTAPGKFGQSLQFDGGDDYVAINPFAKPSADYVTVSAWVKTSSTAFKMILDSRDGGTDGFYLYIDSGRPVFAINDTASAAGTTAGYASFNIADNQWHHVVGIFDRTLGSGNIKILVDNTCPSDSSVCNNTYTTAVAGTSLTTAIGARYTGSAYYFPGSLDDVRVYSRVLSPSEVLRLYDMGR